MFGINGNVPAHVTQTQQVNSAQNAANNREQGAD